MLRNTAGQGRAEAANVTSWRFGESASSGVNERELRCQEGGASYP